MLIDGQKIFVPNYGSGIMKEVKNNKEYDTNKKYISISLVLDNIDLYIPESKLSDYRIRNIESRENLNKAFIIIQDEPRDIEKKWNKRYRQNNDKIKGGNLFEMCEVIRDLYYLNRKGIIPPGERKILCKAENMLASEISLVFDIKMEEALNKIRRLSE